MSDALVSDANINHYRILRKIGAGGMGEVFLAEDTKLGRKVAIKFLNEESARDAGSLRRFVQEAKAASALNHPNILTVYEIGESEGRNYISAEFVKGENLREKLRSQPFTLLETLDITIQIAKALNAAHDAGIVHRDIKPENVMLREDGLAKVLDFGLAKLTPKNNEVSSVDSAKTLPGTLMGTVAYMSPEQARGKEVDERSDIWSFGVLLYEMLARRAPFAGETTTDLIISIVQKEPPALRNFAPALPNELYFIVGKLLRKKADERYQNISDVLNDLRRIKRRLDYEEIESPLSLGDSTTQMPSLENQTTISNQQPQLLNSSEIDSNGAEKTPPNNLSLEFTPLIGREAEIEEIKRLLKQPGTRLLTVTGVGGTGKTSLAQTVAHESLTEFKDGTYFINLSAIETAALVVPIIAQTLGVKEESGKSLKEMLEKSLSERKILLVLDNFEQITEAASSVGELLSAAKNLKILVTSRVRLHLSFEREFVLQPLGVPTDNRLSLRELGEYAAIALFVERARAVKSGFELTEENASSVTEICRRLDGLPLALELAAARVKLLAPQAILTRLSHSLKLLTGGARDLPERQQTMRAAIRWSYDLLDSEEQKLLNRLATCGGGLTLDAAEAVANADGDLKIDLFDGIASLVDNSLLALREQADGEPRFRMLALVREFALEELEASGEASEIRRRHAEFFARLSEEAAPHLSGAKAAEWFEQIEDEHDNLRLALDWSLGCEPDTALRIVAGIWWFWYRRGYLAEGSRWLKQTLDNTATDAKLQAAAYYGICFLSLLQGDLKAAESYGADGLRIARASGDEESISRAFNGLGSVKNRMGELEAAQALYEEGLKVARASGNRRQIVPLVSNLGALATEREDYEAARKYFEEAIINAKAESMKPLAGTCAANLAQIACLQEDYEAARIYALESLDASEKLGDGIMTAFALNSFGATVFAAGDPEKAARLWGAAHSIFESKGYKINTSEQNFLDRFTARASAAIGAAAYEAAYREGQSMRLKKALALARETT